MKAITFLFAVLMLALGSCTKEKEYPTWVVDAVNRQNWIACNRELPNKNGNYLVFLTREKEGSEVSHMQIMWYEGDGKWNTEPLINEGYTVNVRYWQNLPQEPIVE